MKWVVLFHEKGVYFAASILEGSSRLASRPWFRSRIAAIGIEPPTSAGETQRTSLRVLHHFASSRINLH